MFDVEASNALSDAQKRRVVAKAGPVLRAIAQDERSQLRNKDLATERLVESLREALRVPRRRVPTKPSAASRERRLEQKKRRSQVKRLAAANPGLGARGEPSGCPGAVSARRKFSECALRREVSPRARGRNPQALLTLGLPRGRWCLRHPRHASFASG